MDSNLNVKLNLVSGDFKSSMNGIKNSVKGVNQETLGLNNTMKLLDSSLGKLGIRTGLIRTISASVKELKQSFGDIFNRKVLNKNLFETIDVKRGQVAEIEALEEKLSSIKKLKDALGDGIFNGSYDEQIENITDKIEILDYALEHTGKQIDILNNRLHNVDNLKELLPKLGALALIIAEIAVVVKSVKNALSAAKLADEVDETSQKLNMASDAYERWVYIYDRAGLTASDLSSTVKKMQTSFAEAATSGEYAASAFGKLGINIEDAKLMSNSELLATVADRLNQVGDNTERTAIAADIFGKNAAGMNVLLNMSSKELENLSRAFKLIGGETSEKLVQDSALLEDTIYDLKIAWQGLKNELAEKFVPVIQKVVKWLVTATVAMQSFIHAFMGNSNNSTILDKFKNAKKDSEDINKNIKEMKRQLMGFDELNVLSDTSTDTDNGSGDGEFESIVSALENVFSEEELNKINEMKKNFEELGKACRAIIPILTIALGIIIAIAGFSSGNVLVGIAGIGLAGIGIGIGALNGAWSDMFESMKKAWENHAAFITGIALCLLGLIAIFAGLPIVGVPLMAAGGIAIVYDHNGAGAWSDMIEKIKTDFENHKSIIVGIALCLLGLWACFAGLPIIGVPLMILGGCSIAYDFMGEEGWSGMIEKIKNIFDKYKLTIIGIALTIIGLILLFTGNLAGVALMAAGGLAIAYDQSGKGWEEILKKVKNAIETVKTYVTGLWTKIKTTFRNIKTTCTDTFTDICDWCEEKFNKMKGFFESLISKAKELVSKTIQAARIADAKEDGSYSAVAYARQQYANGTGKSKNEIITELQNKYAPLKYYAYNEVEDWLRDLGFTFANGGVLTTPTIGLMAEYSGAQSNPEIVTPQNLMYETVVEANAGLANAFAVVGSKIVEAINNKDSNVYIDKTKISREIYGSLQSEGTRRGTSAVSFI